MRARYGRGTNSGKPAGRSFGLDRQRGIEPQQAAQLAGAADALGQDRLPVGPAGRCGVRFVIESATCHQGKCYHNQTTTESETGKTVVASYNTSEFRKGLKVQLDGDPYIMIECNFVKPGKGQALYKCKLRNLLRGTVLDRTYKSGDSLEAAEIDEIQAQFLYRQRPFRLHGQRVLRAIRIDGRAGRRRLEVSQGGNGVQHRVAQQPADQHDAAEPRRVEGGVLRARREGQHRHERHEALQGRDRRRVRLPLLRQHRRSHQDRHPHGRVFGAGERIATKRGVSGSPPSNPLAASRSIAERGEKSNGCVQGLYG